MLTECATEVKGKKGKGQKRKRRVKYVHRQIRKENRQVLTAPKFWTYDSNTCQFKLVKQKHMLRQMNTGLYLGARVWGFFQTYVDFFQNLKKDL